MDKRRILILGCAALLLLGGCTGKEDYAEVSADIADSFPIAAETAGENPQLVHSDGPYAILHTTAGDITILLYPEQAPKSVENFITLAREGYYDGTVFHYVKKNELNQTGLPGDPEETERSMWEDSFESEFDNGLYNFRGAVGMANIDGNLSQFYLLVMDKKQEDERIIPANLYMNELILMRGQELNERGQQESLSEEDLVAFEDELNNEIQAIATDGVPEEYAQKYEPVARRYDEVGGAWSLDYNNTIFGQIVEGLNVADAISQVKVSAENRRPKKDVVIESIEIVE
ncbi:MAG: peptidylprolyl isomerase [Lachnospiraceae bacterium]